jgi:hypothetical protein
VYSVCINRIDRTTRGNTQWSIEGASRWVSIILTTGKGRGAWSGSDKVRTLAGRV